MAVELYMGRSTRPGALAHMQTMIRFGSTHNLVDEAGEDQTMDGVERIPIEQTEQPFGDEIGRLPQLCRTLWCRRRFKLQPCIPRYLHLGPHAEESSLLYPLHPPEINGVAHTNAIGT